jgi:hypothetical protein
MNFVKNKSALVWAERKPRLVVSIVILNLCHKPDYFFKCFQKNEEIRNLVYWWYQGRSRDSFPVLEILAILSRILGNKKLINILKLILVGRDFYLSSTYSVISHSMALLALFLSRLWHLAILLLLRSVSRYGDFFLLVGFF